MIPQPPPTLAGLPPGQHPVDLDSFDLLTEEATGRDFFCVSIDLAECRDKACLLHTFAKALAFPEWFGDNWDALADCLIDLDWLGAPGHVLLIQGDTGIARHAPEVLDICREILAQAIVRRSAHGLPMWVFWHKADSA